MVKITLKQFQLMLLTGVQSIVQETDYINDLNVYPVPDGDTGINMKLTLSKTTDKIYAQEFSDVGTFAKKFAYETLMNARGNSGAIMSQIIKGLTLPLENLKSEIPLAKLFESFEQAKVFAYKSVMTPTEGTMLSVVRFIDERLKQERSQIKTVEALLELVYQASARAVTESPNMLDVLKESNSIDSGAYGLFKFFKGFLEALKLPTPEVDLFSQISKEEHKNVVSHKKENFDKDKISFGYCCEFIVKLNEKVAPNQKEKLPYNYEDINKELNKANAESVVIVQEDDLLKIHAHLIKPYQLLFLGQKYGEFISIKIENMVKQFDEHVSTVIEKSEKLIEFDKNSVILSYLPTTEIFEFVKKHFGLDYFWNLEAKDSPTYRDLVNLIQGTNSKKIFGLISDARQKRKFLSAEKFINKKQDLHLISVDSTVDVLYLISVYEKLKPNWGNSKTLLFNAKRISSFYLNNNPKNNNYSLYHKNRALATNNNLADAIKNLYEQFMCENKKRILKNAYDLCFVYNDLKVAPILKKLVTSIKKETEQTSFAFYVSGEKNLLSLGLIKCPKQEN